MLFHVTSGSEYIDKSNHKLTIVRKRKFRVTFANPHKLLDDVGWSILDLLQTRCPDFFFGTRPTDRSLHACGHRARAPHGGIGHHNGYHASINPPKPASSRGVHAPSHFWWREHGQSRHRRPEAHSGIVECHRVREPIPLFCAPDCSRLRIWNHSSIA